MTRIYGLVASIVVIAPLVYAEFWHATQYWA